MKKYLIITLLSLCFLNSCLEEFPSSDFEFQEQIFISGLMTSEADYVSVDIQKTVPVTNETDFSALNNADVSLFTRDALDIVSLVSDSFIVTDGIYTTSEIITPIIGNSYWVEIVLEDQTRLISEEETLHPAIPIIDVVKNENTVQITYAEPLDEQSLFFIEVNISNNNEIISESLSLFDNRGVIEASERVFNINEVNTGDTVKVTIININFNTYQYYLNVFGNPEDFDTAAFFLPINHNGNIKNAVTNELVLGNFVVAGFNTITMEF